MTDRKTVMSWIEGLTQDDWPIWHSDSEVQETAKAALELLKEQPETVRCKDCKWYSEKGFCKHPNGGAGNIRPADWFCADGVKR